MKVVLKSLAIFIFFSLIFSGLSACSKVADTNTGGISGGDIAKKDAINYPEVSPEALSATLKASDGTELKLEDYKGKVVLVNFWATWCRPCRDEMPELVKIQAENKDKGFEIIGVNADNQEDLEMIKGFAEKMNLNYKLVESNEAVIDSLLKISHADAIPQSYLIDGSGKIRGVWVGGGGKIIAGIRTDVGKLLTAN